MVLKLPNGSISVCGRQFLLVRNEPLCCSKERSSVITTTKIFFGEMDLLDISVCTPS